MIENMFSRLAEPFSVEAVSWRVGSTNQDKSKGLALAFIDARDVADRLDLVCGPEGWQNRYSHTGATVVCEIGIRISPYGRPELDELGFWKTPTPFEWLWKADGAGATDVEAEKGALSDAFKRAAVRWGIGRYLYSLPSPWVTLVPAGRSWKIADGEYGKLRSLLRIHAGVTAKSSAQAIRDKDFEYYAEKVGAASDLEILGAVGREIKENIHRLPAAMRDPLHDLYAERLDTLKGHNDLALLHSADPLGQDGALRA